MANCPSRGKGEQQFTPITGILDTLPDELVDCICRFARDLPALPAYETRSTWFWEPSSRYLLEMRFPPPLTFLALRLVCKRLNRIATPYLWETLDVQLRHQPKNDIPSLLRSGKPRVLGLERQVPGSFNLKRSRNSVHIFEYLASNPHLAGMVRVLCLRVSGYTFAAMAREETECDLERLIEGLLIETKGLTAFCIDKADLLTPLAASTLLSYKTLRLVDLRTVGFRGEGLEVFSGCEMEGLEYFGLSVFNLAYKSLRMPRNLRKVSLHCDSMSTFVREETPPLLMEGKKGLCVGTVEELAIYDKHGDVALFVSKHFLNARTQGHQVSLKELFLDLEWCHASRLNKILASFRGPTVRKLTLRNLHRMAPGGLAKIAEYFSNVRELCLSSSTTDIVPAWIVGCFHEYVEALKGFKDLETLEWDNSALCYFAKEVEEEEDSGACEASLAALVKLPTLKCVRKISFASRTVTTWAIVQRDEDIRDCDGSNENENRKCVGEGNKVWRGWRGHQVNKTDVFPDFEASQGVIAGLYK